MTDVSDLNKGEKLAERKVRENKPAEETKRWDNNANQGTTQGHQERTQPRIKRPTGGRQVYIGSRGSPSVPFITSREQSEPLDHSDSTFLTGVEIARPQ